LADVRSTTYPGCAVAFQDELRSYLERLLNEVPAARFNPDLRVPRQHLLRELERLEATGMAKDRLGSLHLEWSRRVDSFATQMGSLLVNGLAHSVPLREVEELVNVAPSRELGLEVSTGSFVKDAELDRLSRKLDPFLGQDEADVAQYALEIRAARRGGDRRHVTPIGRIALELPERDILRWLLTAEAVQSRGPVDEWRLSRTVAAELRRRQADLCQHQGERSFPAMHATMR
jgi:hypothetical protein